MATNYFESLDTVLQCQRARKKVDCEMPDTFEFDGVLLDTDKTLQVLRDVYSRRLNEQLLESGEIGQK